MNSYSKLIDILAVGIVLFMVPAYYFMQKGELLAQSIAYESTKDFVANIQTHGYITKNMYEDYLNSLSIIKENYRIYLEHTEKIFEPIYEGKRNSSEITIFTGNITTYDKITYTDEILDSIYERQDIYKVNPGDNIKVTIEVQRNVGLLYDFLDSDHRYFCYTAYSGMIRDRQNWRE